MTSAEDEEEEEEDHSLIFVKSFTCDLVGLTDWLTACTWKGKGGVLSSPLSSTECRYLYLPAVPLSLFDRNEDSSMFVWAIHQPLTERSKWDAQLHHKERLMSARHSSFSMGIIGCCCCGCSDWSRDLSAGDDDDGGGGDDSMDGGVARVKRPWHPDCILCGYNRNNAPSPLRVDKHTQRPFIEVGVCFHSGVVCFRTSLTAWIAVCASLVVVSCLWWLFDYYGPTMALEVALIFK